MPECHSGGYCTDDYICSTYQDKGDCPYRLVEASRKQLERIGKLVKDVPTDDSIVTPVCVDQHAEPY